MRAKSIIILWNFFCVWLLLLSVTATSTATPDNDTHSDDTDPSEVARGNRIDVVMEPRLQASSPMDDDSHDQSDAIVFEWEENKHNNITVDMKAVENVTVLVNDYKRNSSGEYRLEIEFSDNTRRIEVGEFEWLESSRRVFVIRGLFTYLDQGVLRNVLYKIDPDKGYMTFEDPLMQSIDFRPDFGGEGGSSDCEASRCIDQKLINILLG